MRMGSTNLPAVAVGCTLCRQPQLHEQLREALQTYGAEQMLFMCCLTQLPEIPIPQLWITSLHVTCLLGLHRRLAKAAFKQWSAVKVELVQAAWNKKTEEQKWNYLCQVAMQSQSISGWFRRVS